MTLDPSRIRCAFSGDRVYRYRWQYDLAPLIQRTIVFVMLNPSTADESDADPTIRRCIRFADREQCGRLIVVNLYALRSTDPRALALHPSPESESDRPHENDDAIVAAASEASFVVAAWGASAPDRQRAQSVVTIIRAAGRSMLCLGTTRDGHPRHPLYLPGSVAVVPFHPARSAGEAVL